MAVQTVHTSGINWASVAAITTAVVLVMSTIFATVARYVSSQVTGAINKLRVDVINKLDTRLTAVETKLDTVNRNNPKRNGR
jgi:BMFP domain-containing protein YqiC